MTVTRKFPRSKPFRMKVAEVKAIVRFRDGYRCVQCGMTAKEHHQKYRQTLDVHRLTPGSRYTVKGCVTLCRKCHGPQPKRPRKSSLHKNVTIELDARLRRMVAIVAAAKGFSVHDYLKEVIRDIVEAAYRDFVHEELQRVRPPEE